MSEATAQDLINELITHDRSPDREVAGIIPAMIKIFSKSPSMLRKLVMLTMAEKSQSLLIRSTVFPPYGKIDERAPVSVAIPSNQVNGLSPPPLKYIKLKGTNNFFRGSHYPRYLSTYPFFSISRLPYNIRLLRMRASF